MAEKGLAKAIRFDLNAPSEQKIETEAPIGGGESRRACYELRNYPLYLADWMEELAERWHSNHRCS